MPLVDMRDLLQHAYRHGYAVGAFDLVGLDFLEGVMAAVERAHAPVILGLDESHFEYCDFELVMPAVEAAARRASVPVAIHLDHGTSLDSAVRAINIGCNGVMVDASYKSLQENLDISLNLVEMALGCGVSVEGALGYAPEIEGEDAERHPGEIAYTTPEEAKSYVEKTGVDFLAVSIGIGKTGSCFVPHGETLFVDEYGRTSHDLTPSFRYYSDPIIHIRPWPVICTGPRRPVSAGRCSGINGARPH